MVSKIHLYVIISLSINVILPKYGQSGPLLAPLSTTEISENPLTDSLRQPVTKKTAYQQVLHSFMPSSFMSSDVNLITIEEFFESVLERERRYVTRAQHDVENSVDEGERKLNEEWLAGVKKDYRSIRRMIQVIKTKMDKQTIKSLLDVFLAVDKTIGEALKEKRQEIDILEQFLTFSKWHDKHSVHVIYASPESYVRNIFTHNTEIFHTEKGTEMIIIADPKDANSFHLVEHFIADVLNNNLLPSLNTIKGKKIPGERFLFGVLQKALMTEIIMHFSQSFPQIAARSKEYEEKLEYNVLQSMVFYLTKNGYRKDSALLMIQEAVSQGDFSQLSQSMGACFFGIRSLLWRLSLEKNGDMNMHNLIMHIIIRAISTNSSKTAAKVLHLGKIIVDIYESVDCSMVNNNLHNFIRIIPHFNEARKIGIHALLNDMEDLLNLPIQEAIEQLIQSYEKHLLTELSSQKDIANFYNDIQITFKDHPLRKMLETRKIEILIKPHYLQNWSL